MTTAANTTQSSQVNAPADDGSPSEPDNPAESEPEPSGTTVCADPALGEAGARIDTAWIAARLRDAIDQLGRPVRAVNVSIVGDGPMRELHRRHLADGGPTDVLTFPLAGAGAPIEADIVVCLDVAAGASAERGHRVEQELLLYALHGVLHCAGFEDKTEEGFAAMHDEEDRILAAIGVGTTFRRDAADREGLPT